MLKADIPSLLSFVEAAHKIRRVGVFSIACFHLILVSEFALIYGWLLFDKVGLCLPLSALLLLYLKLFLNKWSLEEDLHICLSIGRRSENRMIHLWQDVLALVDCRKILFLLEAELGSGPLF